MKKILLFAGLPGTGKDMALSYLKELKPEYNSINYSQEVLKPIINNPNSITTKLKYFGNEFKNIGILIDEIFEYKKTKTGRKLYIDLAQILLKEYISKQTNNKFNHFSLFAQDFFDNNNYIIIPSFRQKEEINVLKTLYPNSEIHPILITSDETKRFEMMQKIRNKDYDTLKAEDDYEKEMTYNKQINEINFVYQIKNCYTDNFKITIENLIKNLNL